MSDPEIYRASLSLVTSTQGRPRTSKLGSDQTPAIPHWLWNQPSAPPVHPEDGARGCLSSAVKVSEPLSSSYRRKVRQPKGPSTQTRHFPVKLQPQGRMPKTSKLSSDQTPAIPHWLWNQPSAPPVHPEDGARGCLGSAVKVSEPLSSSFRRKVRQLRPLTVP